MLYACDRSWWRHHEVHTRAFTGQRWTQNQGWQKGEAEALGLGVIRSANRPGLSTEQGLIHQGANSGYQAINLAWHLGARRILLLGYDMQGLGDHWFGKHKAKGLSKNTNYTSLLSKFDTIRPADYGLEIINCTRETALTCFPRMDLGGAIDGKRQAA